MSQISHGVRPEALRNRDLSVWGCISNVMMLFFASKLFRLSVFTYPAAMPTSWTCILFSDCVCILILRGESFRWKRAIFIPWWRCRNVLFRSHTTLMEMMRMRWGFELQTFPIFLVFNSCEDRAFTFQSVKNVKNWNESSHFHFKKEKGKNRPFTQCSKIT